jgi:hypothetical protein
MFKLVGDETFSFGKGTDSHQGRLAIRADGLKYKYGLQSNGEDGLQ